MSLVSIVSSLKDNMCIKGGMLITQSFNLNDKRRIEGRGEKGEAGWMIRMSRKEEKGERRNWMDGKDE